VLLFADTNLLVYARDATDPLKQARAHEWMDLLWRGGQGRVSTQVLHEYYVTVTRKLKPSLKRDDARADVRDLSAWNPVRLDTEILEAAWVIEGRSKISFWDCLIVAAAHASHCDVLLTEDLQHGSDFDGLTVVDPFQISVGDLAAHMNE